MNLSTLLRGLYDQPGPWASVYLDASHDTEDAAAAAGLRWRALRERLTDQGADPATVEALEAAVLDPPRRPGRVGLALFAAGGELRLSVPLAAPPRAELATWAPLPHVMPLVAQRGQEVPWLRVVADRLGADLEGVTMGGVPRHQEITGGQRHPIHKASAGGWSELRFQHAVEESWRRNAGDTAAAAADLADEIGAEVLVVAGDVRAVTLLVDQLPERWRDRVVRTDAGSRAAGADPGQLDDVTIQAIAEVAARHTEDALDRYRQQYGNGAAAGTGLAAVVAALQRGQVDTVLMVDDASAAEELWIGPEPTQLALTADELRAMGVAQPQRVRADAALLRAVTGTDAALVLVGPGEAPLEGGVGALLRYADAGTRRR
ncbi:MAG TPA: Vms1/Ankzf1 family peptidyl-tRNA hydrolase [Pilimelia sp.]|nr:Vms1/Ankzf1 family peptidyl-tRNA hydrolase [Pilimelia sp.]